MPRKQLSLKGIREDSANARALPEGGAGFVRRSARIKLKSFPIASSKKEAVKETHIGFYRGQRIYLWCPFHLERTPSCVWYPKGSKGVDPWSYGTRESLLNIVNDLLILQSYAEKPKADMIAGIAEGILRMAIRRWWAERHGTQESRTAHFHCYGCGRTGEETELVRGLKNPIKPRPFCWEPESSEHWDGKCPF